MVRMDEQLGEWVMGMGSKLPELRGRVGKSVLTRGDLRVLFIGSDPTSIAAPGEPPLFVSSTARSVLRLNCCRGASRKQAARFSTVITRSSMAILLGCPDSRPQGPHICELHRQQGTMRVNQGVRWCGQCAARGWSVCYPRGDSVDPGRWAE